MATIICFKKSTPSTATLVHSVEPRSRRRIQISHALGVCFVFPPPYVQLGLSASKMHVKLPNGRLRSCAPSWRVRTSLRRVGILQHGHDSSWTSLQMGLVRCTWMHSILAFLVVISLVKPLTGRCAVFAGISTVFEHPVSARRMLGLAKTSSTSRIQHQNTLGRPARWHVARFVSWQPPSSLPPKIRQSHRAGARLRYVTPLPF